MIEAFIVVMIGAGVVAAIVEFNRHRASQAEAKAQNDLRLQQIRPIQEQIAKLETASIKDSESFKSAKEAYDAKYRNSPNTSNQPSNNDGSSGSSKL